MQKPKTTEDRYALIGIFVGMGIAAVIAFVFAFNSGTMVRYLIMAAGLVIGWLAGRALGRSKMRGEGGDLP